MPAIKIAPSVLAADFAHLGQQIADAQSGGADAIHFDVMDGHFVPNLTMGPAVLEAARRSTTLPIDVHLMMFEPEILFPAFAKAGASSLSVHVEACPNLHRTLQAIKAVGCKVGVAINPATPAIMLGEIVHLLDLILVMTVNPGFGGQEFLPETLPKIKQLRALCDHAGRSIDIAVDGGINVHNAAEVVAAGANVLIAGSSIFSHEESVAAGIEHLRRAGTK